MPQNSAHKRSRVSQCRIIELPRRRHENGSLTEVENVSGALFPVRRVFYLYDVPGDSERGGHSHHLAQELIISASGAFSVVVDDGHERRTFTLDRPYRALYIPSGIWRELNNFSSGSVSLVLTSELYSEEDYVRSYERFKQLTANKI